MQNIKITKTAVLRKLIKSLLDTVDGKTYHRNADDDAHFPYKTFNISPIIHNESGRDDISLTVDIFDKGIDPKTVEAIADNIERLFCNTNYPYSLGVGSKTINIYPSFFLDTRLNLNENDDLIQHIRMQITIQNYTDILTDTEEA